MNETVYVVNTDSLNPRSGPGTDYDKVGSLGWGQSATRTGTGIEGLEAEGWSRLTLEDGSEVYVSSKYLSTTKPVASKPSGSHSKPAASTPSGGSDTTQSQTEPNAVLPPNWKNRLEEVGKGFEGSSQLDPENAKNGTTTGWTDIYH